MEALSTSDSVVMEKYPSKTHTHKLRTARPRFDLTEEMGNEETKDTHTENLG